MSKIMKDGLTVVTETKEENNEEPRVRVFIAPPEEADSGIKTDPYEHVTINGNTTLIRRGEYVDVPVPVYIQLRNKYPHI